MKTMATESVGTALQPVCHAVFVQGNDEFFYNRDIFSYESGGEKTVGYNANIQFTVASPARRVWPIFKDFNLWQNDFGHYYSGAFGDKEGEMVHITDKNRGPPQGFYIVEHSIPEHLLVLAQPVCETDGIKHIGTHAFILTDRGHKTVVTGLMQHAKRSATLDVAGTIAEYDVMIREAKVHKWATVLGQALRARVAASPSSP